MEQLAAQNHLDNITMIPKVNISMIPKVIIIIMPKVNIPIIPKINITMIKVGPKNQPKYISGR